MMWNSLTLHVSRAIIKIVHLCLFVLADRLNAGSPMLLGFSVFAGDGETRRVGEALALNSKFLSPSAMLLV
jgi:hypothetical protein